ncbi:uncharacterized protein LOC62_03G005176 [Vanrija pseudolonga]|uniref:TERF2-interacting telomeric protein 1 Myb domain-containing protein n=1 Tax=Vanrija pseudolonga TaxID=143232 RepID=A0AAF0YDS2_9TREE|nr:hypothetical protein LOC62_03G005176 [Vanrija pseudolonga]
MAAVLAEDVVFFDTASLNEDTIERLTISAKQLGARVTDDASDATITLANPRSPNYNPDAEHTGYHWLAACRYAGARADPAALDPLLFVNPERATANAPLLAYVSLNLQRTAREDAPSARAAVEEQLARHGALLVPHFSTAELVIVDRKTDFFKKVDAAKKKHGRDWQRLGERFWVESCVAAREVMWATAHEVEEDEVAAKEEAERQEEEKRRQREDSFVEDDAAQYKRGPGRPVGKPRNDYTPQEDDFLCRWLAAFRPDGGWMSRKTYDAMAASADTFPLAARHPPQSWRERFKKNEQPFRKRVERFKRARIDERLEDDEDRRVRRERPESTKAALVVDADGLEVWKTKKAPAIGRSARVVAAVPGKVVVVPNKPRPEGSRSAVREKSAEGAGTAREKSTERTSESSAAKKPAPPASATDADADAAPATKKDKGKGVDRSPAEPAPAAPTRSEEAADRLRRINWAVTPAHDKETEDDGTAFFALLASTKEDKAGKSAAVAKPSPAKSNGAAAATPGKPAPVEAEPSKLAQVTAARHDFDETMASAIIGGDESQPADAPSPAPAAPAPTQPVSTQAEPSSTTAPHATQPVPPGQQRRSSPRSSSPPHGTSQDDESQDSIQKAIAAEYAKRKAEVVARKSLTASEAKPVVASPAEPKSEAPSTPPRTKRLRVTEPLSPARSTLQTSPSIHVIVSPGRRRSVPTADGTGRVRIPVTLDLDIDVRTTTTMADAMPSSSKRLLDATTQESTQESDAPVKKRRHRTQTESQVERQRAGAKIVTNMRDVYKEKIATYATQYGKTARELYTIVNALPRKGGDRGGAMFWVDVEAGLRDMFGH